MSGTVAAGKVEQMSNFETLICPAEPVVDNGVNCTVCVGLQQKVEVAARELSRAIQDAMIAIAPLSGLAAGNRIDQAEKNLRSASRSFSKHQSACQETRRKDDEVSR